MSLNRLRRSRSTRSAMVVFASVALLATGVTAAVSNAGAATKKTVTITFWNAYNDVTETPVMNGIVIPAFESQNPGIKVKDDTLPYAALLQKWIASSAAGDPPDLMRSDIAWVPQLAAQGVVQNVGKLPAFPAIQKNTLPGPLATTHLATGEQPGYYAFPDDTNTQALYWNKTDFAAAGISGPPKTLSQMYADAAKLTNPAKQQFGLGIDGTQIWNTAPYVWSAGGSFTSTKYTQASGFMDSPATVNAVSQLMSLLKAGDIGSDFEGSYRLDGTSVIPSIAGRAFVNADSHLLLDPADPYCMGIPE